MREMAFNDIWVFANVNDLDFNTAHKPCCLREAVEKNNHSRIKEVEKQNKQASTSVLENKPAEYIVVYEGVLQPGLVEDYFPDQDSAMEAVSRIRGDGFAAFLKTTH
jgi:hypothetical protein